MYVAYEVKLVKTKVKGKPCRLDWKSEKKDVKKLPEFLEELDDLKRLRRSLAQRIQVICSQASEKRKRTRRRNGKEVNNDGTVLSRLKRRYRATEKLIQQMESIIYRCLARK
ncbi:Oidioi.mRNA.OKI2018_I69.PAR.g12897.t1.cds [Oikopleura dioica]|uniref:Oidioi.mRNA.OKI2018_I69.PAR.g12897.t1.cds n=1 Tax=Oikopleura dioica TaxID=34765 RepID=A0ABN7S9X7_OIKDI|nr:Oidioi.mRNA.OKI2018_I69.PAR.g12897.t1.cds [Oikopleura dioica]